METVEQLLNERLAPIAPLLAQVQEQQVEGRIYQAFEAVKANGVQFDDGMARQAAEALAACGRVGTFEDALRGGIAHAILTEQRLQERWRGAVTEPGSARQRPPGAAGRAPHRKQEARSPGRTPTKQAKNQFFADRRAAGRPGA